jgi:hypothetical protein
VKTNPVNTLKETKGDLKQAIISENAKNVLI